MTAIGIVAQNQANAHARVVSRNRQWLAETIRVSLHRIAAGYNVYRSDGKKGCLGIFLFRLKGKNFRRLYTPNPRILPQNGDIFNAWLWYDRQCLSDRKYSGHSVILVVPEGYGQGVVMHSVGPCLKIPLFRMRNKRLDLIQTMTIAFFKIGTEFV